jgi:hypothetical protein
VWTVCADFVLYWVMYQCSRHSHKCRAGLYMMYARVSLYNMTVPVR